jgi:hypothetical protein
MYPIIDDTFIKSRPLSYSSLKAFRKSPKHYLEYLITPRISTDAMLLGSVCEKLLLYSKEEFEKEYLVYSLSDSKASKAGKEQFTQYCNQANANNVTLVTKDTFDTGCKVVESLRSYKELQPFLNNIKKKRLCLRWTDNSTRLPCIGFTDWDSKVENQLFICDLKVTKDGDPDVFNRNAWNYDYHVQVGSYLEGYKNTRYQFPYFIFVVAESVEPFNVSLMFVDNSYAEFCRDEFKGTLKAFRYAMDNNLFMQGYEFRLMELKSYFSLTKPGYGKTRFGNFCDE